MKAFVTGLKHFYRDEQGAQGVEYALLAGLIAVAFIAGATVLGTNLNAFFTNVSTCVQTPATCSPWS